jgi:hypothetical protein
MLSEMHMEATILLTVGSDHWKIHLSLDIQNMPHKRPFKFEIFGSPTQISSTMSKDGGMKLMWT